jgi:pyruvate dehydrogenase E1 component alpha subunit
MTVPIGESTKEPDIYKRAKGYGMYGEKVDGNDVFAVWKAMDEAIDKARSGNGPTLLEFKTYRWRGHWEGDPLNYRTEEELGEWKKKDPIPVFEMKLISDWKVTQAELDIIKKQTYEEVEAAERFAKDSKFPDVATVMDNVFSDAI